MLTDYELDRLGVDLEKYKKSCEKNNIRLLHYPFTTIPN